MVSFEDLVESHAVGVAAEPELVFAGRLADEADLGHVGAGTAVGAAGGADNNFLTRHADFHRELFNAVDQAGQGTLRLGQTEAAGRQRRAGHRGGVEHAGLVLGLHAVGGEQGREGVAVGVRDVGEDDVLVAAETELDGGEFLRDLAERRLHRVAGDVLDASGLDEEREEI